MAIMKSKTKALATNQKDQLGDNKKTALKHFHNAQNEKYLIKNGNIGNPYNLMFSKIVGETYASDIVNTDSNK